MLGTAARWEIARLAGLLLLPLIIFAQTANFPIVNYDDAEMLANEQLAAGLTFDSIIWAFTSFDFVLYHPITWLTLLLDVEIHGGSSNGMHIVNVLFHLANTLLLYWTLRVLTLAVNRPFWVAAMFAAHPLHVESVAWIAERKDVVSTFFMFGSLLCYAYCCRRNSRGLYWGSWFLFLIALLAKPMVVTLPCLMLLMDIWPLNRVLGISAAEAKQELRPVTLLRAIVEKVPFFLLVPIAFVSAVVGHEIEYAAGTSAREPLALSFRLANAVYSYGMYLFKTLVPVGLAPHYPHPRENISLLLVAGSAVVLIMLTLLAWWQWKRRPYLLIGWLWFAGMLVPVLKIIDFGGSFGMADRFTYVPLVGLFTATVWLLAEFATGSKARLRLLQLGGATLLILWTFLAWHQTGYWQNSETLMRHTLAVTQNNDMANFLLAKALLAEGKRTDAVPYLQRTVEITPESPVAWHLLGRVLYEVGQPKEAIAALTQLVALQKDPVCLHDLGLAYLDDRQYAPAVENLQAAFEMAPENEQYREDFCFACCTNGIELIQAGQPLPALKLFDRAISICPADAASYNGKGIACLLLGRSDDGIRFLKKAVDLAPANLEFRANWQRAIQEAKGKSGSK